MKKTRFLRIAIEATGIDSEHHMPVSLLRRLVSSLPGQIYLIGQERLRSRIPNAIDLTGSSYESEPFDLVIGFSPELDPDIAISGPFELSSAQIITRCHGCNQKKCKYSKISLCLADLDIDLLRREVEHALTGSDRKSEPYISERGVETTAVSNLSARLAMGRELIQGTMIIRKAIGDVIMTLPAVETYKAKTGERLCYVTTSDLVPLLDGLEFLDEVRDIETLVIDYVKIYNLEGSVDFLPPELQRVRQDMFADILGVKLESDRYTGYIKPGKEELQFASEMFRDLKRPIVILQPITKSKLRQWGREIELAARKHDWTFVICHHSRIAFPDLPNVLNLSGMTTTAQFAALVHESDLVISPDSAAMHLAGDMNKPCIAIFGGVIPPECRIKYYESVVPMSVEFAECYSVPCWDGMRASCVGEPFYKSCMEAISVEEVIMKGEEIL